MYKYNENMSEIFKFSSYSCIYESKLTETKKKNAYAFLNAMWHKTYNFIWYSRRAHRKKNKNSTFSCRKTDFVTLKNSHM